MGNKRTPGISRPSTAHPQAVLAQQLEASYHSLFEAASEGYIIHHDGVIIEVNARFEELTGYEGSEHWWSSGCARALGNRLRSWG